MAIAERLHKSVAEVLQMSTYEFMLWLGYFELQKEELDTQRRLAQHGKR